MEPEHTLTFGPFRLDISQGRLWREGEEIPLRPRSLAMLHYLAERPGQLVTKAEVLQQVWAGSHVSDGVLRSSVHDIRQVLNDSAQAPQYLETVGRVGYRFLQGIASVGSHQAVGPVVGRQDEVEQLQKYFERATDGKRRFALLSGEPGIGKSTVVNLFLDRVANHVGVRVARGQCIMHFNNGEAYQPLLEALGRLGQGPGGAEVVRVLQRYAPMWLVQLPALVDSSELESLQRQVLGADPSRMVRELSEALEVLAAKTPFILVLEDLHWSDLYTVELLAAIAQRRDPARLLLLGTYRPADAVVHAQPMRDVVQELRARRQCEEIMMEPLSSDDVTAYVAGRLGGPVSASLAQLISRRSDGNPLFMVNLVDHFLQHQVIVQQDEQWVLSAQIQDTVKTIPAGLRPFILRRLDTLSPEEHLALEVASVEGMDYTTAAVAAALQRPVNDVEAVFESMARQDHFIRNGELVQWPDGTTSGRYHFQHSLYHQVIYEQVGPARRAQLHLRLGARLEAGYGDRVSEIAPQLALHFERAQDLQRAVQYTQYAGESAQKRHAHQEATAHFTKGLVLLSTLADTPERSHQELILLIALGASLTVTTGGAEPSVGEVYRRAQEIYERVGETPHLFPILWGLWNFHGARGELRRARESGEHLLDLARGIQNSAYDLGGHLMLGGALMGLGEFTSARDHLEQALVGYDRRQHPHLVDRFGIDPGVLSLALAAHTWWMLGYPDQARLKSQAALALAQDLSHPFSLALALCYAAMLHQFFRKPSAVQRHSEAAIALCEKHGFTYYLDWARIMLNWGRVIQDTSADGITQIQRNFDNAQITGGRVRLMYYLTLLAETYAFSGQPEGGLRRIRQASTETEQTEERFWQAEGYRLTGALLLQVDADSHANEAETHFVEALEIARCQQAKSLELRAATSLSQLWQQQGKWERAQQLLGDVYTSFSEGFETTDLQAAKAVLDDLDR